MSPPFVFFPVSERVIEFIHKVFSEVNDSVSKRISLTPNIPEENLDIAFIDCLGSFAGPTKIDSTWAVQIATHFIGNIRHYRRYELADIGAVIVFKKSTKIVGRKLILLQSKRLYPLNNKIDELDDFDYELGLGKLMRDSPNECSIFSKVKFEFSDRSVYGALRKESEQCKAISDHFKETDIPVYYMFYNPLSIPWETYYPISAESIANSERTFGTRVCNSTDVHRAMLKKSNQNPPCIFDFIAAQGGNSKTFGLSLENFFEEAIRCREGFKFSDSNDRGIRRLFNRKSGPIFCVIEITIEDITA